jgi:hypothetical protein
VTGSQPTKPLLPAPARTLVLGVIASAILIGFILIYSEVFWCATEHNKFLSLKCPADLDDQQLLSISTGLTGLVGGVIAVALAQRQEPEAPGGEAPGDGAPGDGAPGGETPPGDGTTEESNRWLSELGPKGWLALLYTVAYTLLGLVAVLVWVSQGEKAPDTVQALASVSLGLLIPIVRSYFIPGE